MSGRLKVLAKLYVDKKQDRMVVLCVLPSTIEFSIDILITPLYSILNHS
jgi:hypothetical protein